MGWLEIKIAALAVTATLALLFLLLGLDPDQ
jgi:hypothetical protein